LTERVKIPFTELSPEIQEKYGYDSRAATAYGLTQCSQPLVGAMTSSQHVYEIRPRKDHRGVDLISDALPFGRFGITDRTLPATQSAMRSFVIRVCDFAGNVIETHGDAGDFKEP
jgi:hypothetical protein